MTSNRTGQQPDKPKSRLLAGFLLAGIGCVVVVLFLLGNWQVRRLAWKLDLIDRVETRAYGDPVAVPAVSQWPAINRAEHEYLRVSVAGRLLHDKETQVYALTERGPGYWVITPLLVDNGGTILINRGFVPTDRRGSGSRGEGQIQGEVVISGLLRLTEPAGTLIRKNDPETDAWFSRDTAAIARHRGLDNVAPFFIDADATPNPGGLPVGGLTRLAFRNDHLIYAMTWYGLAIMLVAMLCYALRRSRRHDDSG